MSRPLDWEREGRIWPHREASAFVTSEGLSWHIQRMGPKRNSAPKLLLLHGTGASVHSWHGLMPILAEKFDVFAPDLPGHAFTKGRPRGGLTLDGIVDALGELLEAESFAPDMIVGHSAGAAISITFSIKEAFPRAGIIPLIGLNPALMPFRGPAAQVFPAMAKLLLVNPFAPRIFARMAKVPGEAGRFLRRSTGSSPDAISEACYAALFGNHHHAKGALEMMANWDLKALNGHLRGVKNATKLIHASGDTAIPQSSVEAAARLLPNAEFEVLMGAGHLAHEEKPVEVGQAIIQFAMDHGVIMSAPETEAQRAAS